MPIQRPHLPCIATKTVTYNYVNPHPFSNYPSARCYPPYLLSLPHGNFFTTTVAIYVLHFHHPLFRMSSNSPLWHIFEINVRPHAYFSGAPGVPSNVSTKFLYPPHYPKNYHVQFRKCTSFFSDFPYVRCYLPSGAAMRYPKVDFLRLPLSAPP